METPALIPRPERTLTIGLRVGHADQPVSGVARQDEQVRGAPARTDGVYLGAHQYVIGAIRREVAAREDVDINPVAIGSDLEGFLVHGVDEDDIRLVLANCPALAASRDDSTLRVAASLAYQHGRQTIYSVVGENKRADMAHRRRTGIPQAFERPAFNQPRKLDHHICSRPVAVSNRRRHRVAVGYE